MSSLKELEEYIIQHVRENPTGIGSMLADEFSISDREAEDYLQAFCEQGWLSPAGDSYVLQMTDEQQLSVSIPSELSVDSIWLSHLYPLLKHQPVNVVSIIQFGFCEMAANAMAFSGGETLRIKLRIWMDQVQILIADDGMGIFNNLANYFEEDDPGPLALRLVKGGGTTHPGRHTGTGIFYTTRMFDWFSLSSGMHRLTCQSGRFQLFRTNVDFQGTGVILQIRTQADRSPVSVFNQYGQKNDSRQLRATELPVYLLRTDQEYLKHPWQGEDLMEGLEGFDHIVLDFENIEYVSMEFLYAIFRRFYENNPNTRLLPVNINERLRHMIAYFT